MRSGFFGLCGMRGGVRSALSKAVAPGWAPSALAMLGLLTLGGCNPPTTIVDIGSAPQMTRDAMLNVMILPLGMQTPPGVGSVGPVSGFGCGATPVDASGAAVEQLRIKALEMRATGVVDVMLQSSTSTPCQGGYGVLGNGSAVAPRAMPPTW